MSKSSTKNAERVGHTPGPWYVDKPYGEPGVYVAAARDTAIVAKVYEVTRIGWPSGNEEANARLIAAAPELLEALERAVMASDDPGSDYDWVGEAMFAIAKARGQ